MKDDTCWFCEKWVAQTWAQFHNRAHNLRSMPDVQTHPCPHCGNTYWARKPPSRAAFKAERRAGREARSWNMWALAAGAAVLVLVFAVTMLAAHAQTFRDASGRLTGTATRDANGTTTFRDASGRQTGTASRNSNGTTTFRDGSGRMTGTAEGRRR
jgi:hypothetical protein